MKRILRWPVRTYIYSAILFYFALLGIGKGIEFVWFVLSQSAAFSHTSAEAMTSAQGPWDYLLLNEEIAAFRTWALAIVKPIAMGVSGFWPSAGNTLLASPLVSLGFIVLGAAVCCFAAWDLLKDLCQKRAKE